MDEPFLSVGISGGADWRKELETSLKGCDAIVFCFTPEATTSAWVLYEAGYMAASDALVVPFIYGTTVPDPLRHLQAVGLNRQTVGELIDKLAEFETREPVTPTNDDYRARLDEHWPTFDEAIRSLVLLPVTDIVPAEQFSDLFDRKTFREPFPECVDRRWLDRYDAVARARQSLGKEATRQALSTDDYVKGAFRELERLLDRYQMLIGGALLREVEWDDVSERDQQLLELCRKDILRLVRDFDKPSHLPIFTESISYAAADTEARKATIHAFEDRIAGGAMDSKALAEAIESGWDLDRVVGYVAWQKGRISPSVDERVRAIRREEERARTRDLIVGLQPLYYALEAFDHLFSGEGDISQQDLKRFGPNILETIDAVETFIGEHEDRDRGGHIARRTNSIRSKLRAANAPETQPQQ
jgi:hypothetical protein